MVTHHLCDSELVRPVCRELMTMCGDRDTWSDDDTESEISEYNVHSTKLGSLKPRTLSKTKSVGILEC